MRISKGLVALALTTSNSMFGADLFASQEPMSPLPTETKSTLSSQNQNQIDTDEQRAETLHESVTKGEKPSKSISAKRQPTFPSYYGKTPIDVD